MKTLAGQVGAYLVDRELSDGATYLARAEGGRRVVLKAMESDCLLRGQLHPMIKDRLSRVRELAHVGVANLLGVERLEQEAFLVWEYVEGVTLEEHLARPGMDIRDKSSRAIARELAMHVESLHALGIVHGALHARNIIITPEGAVKLTHVSPLLYQDPDADRESLAGTLLGMGMGWAMEGQAGGIGLRETILRLSAGKEVAAESGRERVRSAGTGAGARSMAIAGAVLAAAMGAAAAWGIWRWVRTHASAPTPAAWHGAAVVDQASAGHRPGATQKDGTR